MIEKQTVNINWEEIKSIIYDHIDVSAVFILTLGFFDPNRRFKNPFRPDKHADCSFFQDKKDKRIWLFHDFATGETYNIFRAYETSQGVSFIETVQALADIAKCMDKMNEKGLFLNSKQSLSESPISASELMERLKQKKKEEKLKMDGIKTAEYLAAKQAFLEKQEKEGYTKEKPVLLYEPYAHTMLWQQHHKDFWAKRGVEDGTISQLALNAHALALKQVYTLKPDGTRHIVFTDTSNQPLFLYIKEDWNRKLDTLGDYALQIYRPFSESKASKFRNIGSHNILFKSIPLDLWSIQKDDFFFPWKGLFLAKGYKDAILLKKCFPDWIVGGKCGEASKMQPEYMADIEKEFERKDFPIVIMADNDDKGIKAADAQEVNLLNMGYTNVIKFYFPKSMSPIKDFDDYVCRVVNGMIVKKDWKKLVAQFVKERLESEYNLKL